MKNSSHRFKGFQVFTVGLLILQQKLSRFISLSFQFRHLYIFFSWIVVLQAGRYFLYLKLLFDYLKDHQRSLFEVIHLQKEIIMKQINEVYLLYNNRVIVFLSLNFNTYYWNGHPFYLKLIDYKNSIIKYKWIINFINMILIFIL